ncbi:MAG: histidine triad (HIT) protein [Spirochaetes bacterium]|nr:MAG: histidine triad (HIT) protein [Spirochaetota bacterium]
MEYFFSFEKLGYLKGGKPDACILCLVRDGSQAVERLVVHENPLCLISLNLYPYNPGHVLVFPKRHLTDVREMNPMEKQAVDEAVDLCLEVLDLIYKPAGYNIGYNQGMVAGGSIEHLHLHIIPRYKNEIGIAELLGGKKVLVQDPRTTLEILRDAFGSRGKDD